MTWQKELQDALAALKRHESDRDREEQDGSVERLRRDANDVISQHPVLAELLPTSDQWHLYSLSSGYPYNTEQLKSALTDHVLRAVEESGVAAASRRCEAFLRGAAETCLPGFDITLFAGLDLSERWDIAPGQYLVPYQTAQRQFARPRARFPQLSFIGFDTDVLNNTTALVTELRWGPAITDANRKLTDPDPMKIELAYDRAPLLAVALLGRARPPVAGCRHHIQIRSLDRRLPGPRGWRRHKLRSEGPHRFCRQKCGQRGRTGSRRKGDTGLGLVCEAGARDARSCYCATFHIAFAPRFMGDIESGSR